MDESRQPNVIKLNEFYQLIGTEILRFQDDKETKDYKLWKVKQHELIEIRAAAKPGFVLKVGNNLYYAEVPREAHLHVSAKRHTKHKCGNCSKLKQVIYGCGGCGKILDCSIDTYRREGCSEKKAVVLSKRIEKYEFIVLGFETFNVEAEDFTVVRCQNYVQGQTYTPRNAY